MTVLRQDSDGSLDGENLQSLQKFIQGLNYSLILLQFGKNSDEANEFVDTNPDADENLLFVKDLFRKAFPEK